ncbi:hypothetical protein [Paenibacillus sp. FSL R10-2734]|uniref:hypothetical protein n=1 Tax=Paenibacillus sp. FSL R10-2734 TaxID=2954691 RepID=UPI0030D780F1
MFLFWKRSHEDEYSEGADLEPDWLSGEVKSDKQLSESDETGLQSQGLEGEGPHWN